MSNKIDLSSPIANMFGLEACPQCKSRYRWPKKGIGDPVVCDDCGLEETDTWQFCVACSHPHHIEGEGPACPACDCTENARS